MSDWQQILHEQNWFRDIRVCCGRFVSCGVGNVCNGCTIPEDRQREVISLIPDSRQGDSSEQSADGVI